ncbi:flavin-containing monooxygenase [Nakamurella alba]|nr:NAD(P)/FAD-dependent oxidoreductase [Nakamurella alba]
MVIRLKRHEFDHPLPRVAVIGGGFSGIAAGVALRRAGLPFTIFERSADIGGTWWDNTYPGAEVDTPSVLYSFSYAPRVWSRTHVRQRELLCYLGDVADRFRIREHVRTGTAVDRVEWVEEEQAYRLTSGERDLGAFQVVVSAVGFLNIPRYPEWPGLDEFAGLAVHTSRWPRGLDVRGKRVAVVGTGSTAAQVVPTIAPDCAALMLFQREPGWVLPKLDRDYSEAEKDAMRSPTAQRLNRFAMLWRREKSQYRNAGWRPGTPQNAAAEATARSYIGTTFADRPELAGIVTPAYSYGGKRPVLSDAFYPALLRPNVSVVPRAVDRVTRAGVVDTDGQEHDVDVLVMATGFRTDFGFEFDVISRDGRKLAQVWDGEPSAMLGLMVPDVPNFFMMYGPNTNGGAIVTHLEAQASYIARAVRSMVRAGADRIEVRRRPTEIFNRVLQRRLAGTAFATANNYYKSGSGRIVTQWSDGAILYALATRLLGRPTWKYGGAPRRSRWQDLTRLAHRTSVLARVDTGGVWTTADE